MQGDYCTLTFFYVDIDCQLRVISRIVITCDMALLHLVLKCQWDDDIGNQSNTKIRVFFNSSNMNIKNQLKLF